MVVALGSLVGIVAFYTILVPLRVGGTVTDVGIFPRSFFILEGMLTLAGFGGARFLIRASTEWHSWRPGDPDRRREQYHGDRRAARLLQRLRDGEHHPLTASPHVPTNAKAVLAWARACSAASPAASPCPA